MRQIPGPGEGRDIIVGSIGDTWGVPLTRDMVNSNGFSLKQWYGGTWDDTHTLEVDVIEMIVYYGNPFGDIEAQTVKLTGTPARPSDAVNRGYVDSRIIVSSNIADGTVTGEKLADGAVTALKLADDVDNRYVCKDRPEEQVMVGPLTIQDKLVAHGQWEVWDVPILLMGNDAKLTTAAGIDLALDADTGRSIRALKPLKLPCNTDGNGQVGRGTANGFTTTIACDACTIANSTVVITPCADIGVGNRYWVEIINNHEFEVHQSDDSKTWSFNYLVVPSSN